MLAKLSTVRYSIWATRDGKDKWEGFEGAGWPAGRRAVPWAREVQGDHGGAGADLCRDVRILDFIIAHRSSEKRTDFLSSKRAKISFVTLLMSTMLGAKFIQVYKFYLPIISDNFFFLSQNVILSSLVDGKVRWTRNCDIPFREIRNFCEI